MNRNHKQRGLTQQSWSISNLLCRGLVAALAISVLGCWFEALSFRRATPEPLTQPESKPGSPTDLGRIQFVDVAQSIGIQWTTRNGEEARKFTMPEAFGTGCAIDDFDRDDRWDLYMGGGGVFEGESTIRSLPIGLFRQTQEWTFHPVTESAGLQPIRHYHHGLWSADTNEDGFPDLLITGWDGLQLWQNQGDGTFVDVTISSGLSTDHLWSLAAGWGDFNRDQILDLYVGHYVDWSFKNDPICLDPRIHERNVCSPTDFRGLPCTVYLGNGDGTFTDSSDKLGIHEIGKTLGVVIFDVNEDGQSDIYVANDTLPNQFYVSQKSGAYRESGIEYGVALGETGTSDGSMGVDIGDLDCDGKIDIWVANYENQSFAFYRNLGSELFTHSSRPFGITAVGTLAVGFGTVISDFDGDGYPDIFCSNGHVDSPNSAFNPDQIPYLFWNRLGKGFVDIAPYAGEYMRQKHRGRGTAAGDLDGNGTIDLVITHTNEPASVLKNISPVRNWLSLRLVGTSSPRSAIGARITIVADGRIRKDCVKGGGSYLSTSTRTAYFGLGNSTTVESIDIEWPSGAVTHRANIASGQSLLVIEGIE